MQKKRLIFFLSHLLVLLLAVAAFAATQAQDYKEDFLLSQIAFEIKLGEKQELVVLDTPRVGNDDQAYNREDLVFEFIRGEGLVSVQRELPSGAEKDKIYIYGLSEGVAEIKISYPDYKGQDTVIVVNVTPANPSGPEINTDIKLTKYDTVYFLEDGINFSFGVTAADGATIAAQVNGQVYTPASGILSVFLKDGYNPIVITAEHHTGTTTKVYNIRAKKIDYNVVNLTRPDSDQFYEGDMITFDFTGLVLPVPKVSRIYNPSDVHITYNTDMPRYSVVTGGAKQYHIDAVEMEMTAAGTFNLFNGHIDVNWFGSGLYAESPVGTAPPVTDADQLDHSFSVLPGIQISVNDNPEYDPFLFTVNIENTEEIWPGDTVKLTIPDLDIETIDREHPVDPIGGWWIATLIDSYTLFSTEIPGLDRVKSGHAKVNQELENLKTIEFVVPKDTEPGTYKVRGGYTWVKHGPNWWTRVAYYFKSMIPDVTIEVKPPVPGQIHGEIQIDNSLLKNKLAIAAGKEDGYVPNLTTAELKSITGAVDLADAGVTDADMSLMQYLIKATAIDLSNNPGITKATVKKETFDWTLEKTLDFSGCTGLTELKDAAFRGCANLVSIILPSSLTRLGENCFALCINLSEIILPMGLETIGNRCFYDCRKLTEAVIPDSVKTLGNEAFSSCTKLESVFLSNTLVSIGDQCFYGCGRLTEMILPQSLTTIGSQGFTWSGLQLINFPENLSQIGNMAFTGTKLKIVDARGSQFTTPEGSNWQISEKAAFLTGSDARFSPLTATLRLGQETLTISYQIPGSETVVWGSSDPDIAVVKDGVVTGIQPGTAYIWAATAEKSYSGYCRVTVTDDDKATLRALRLPGISLNEPLTPGKYFYTADIAGDVRRTFVLARVKEPGAVIHVNGMRVPHNAPSRPVSLTYPETNINIKVTSRDGSARKSYFIKVRMAAVTYKEANGDWLVILANRTLKDRLARAAGKGANYAPNLTYTELTGITGPIDLSNAGITDADMEMMQCLTSVSAIDLSDNPGITTSGLWGTFDWSTKKSLDFSGCTGIYENWPSLFSGQKNLTEIILPETVTSIGSSAFEGCSGLTHVGLPPNLTHIGYQAFSGCSALARIDLPDSVKTFGDYCFQYSGLEEISLPPGLTNIPRRCFYACERLTHLTLPASVTEVGAHSFRYCKSLAVLDLRQTGFAAEDVAASWWLVPDTTLILYSQTASAGLNHHSANITLGQESLALSHTIPQGQEVVWFSSDPSVAVVSANGEVRGIKSGTVYITVRTPDGSYGDFCKVTFVDGGSSGLSGLALTGVALNEPFDPSRFFYTASVGCYTQGVQITASLSDTNCQVRINGLPAVDNAPKPISLTMGTNTISVAVTKGGATSTYIVAVEMKEVYEGESGISIANTDFTQKLAGAAGKSPDYLGPLTYQELAGIQGSLDLSNLGLADADMAVMKYLTGVSAIDLSSNPMISSGAVKKENFDWTLPKHLNFSGCIGIVKIIDKAFYNCSGLTGIVLPDTVTEMGNTCFYNCTALADLVIPNGVTRIGYSCFRNASLLTSITFPGSVTHVGSEAFRGCTALVQADLSQVSPEALAESEGLFEGCTAIFDLKKVKLPQGMTRLPSQFFYGCTSIKEIELPSSITAFGDQTFSHTGLVTADLTGITELGTGVLMYCDSLTQIIFPEGITRIPDSFLSRSTGLVSIKIPDTVTEIGRNAFEECTGLRTVELPDNVVTIGYGLFQECEKLESVRLPGGLTTLPSNTFYKCTALKEVVLPASLTAIQGGCFMNAGVTYLAIPSGVTQIGRGCFRSCAYLDILDLRSTGFSQADGNWALPSHTTVLYPGEDAGLSFTGQALSAGGSLELTHQIPRDKPVTWASSNYKVATVSGEGIVTGVSHGTAVIAVKSDDDTYSGICRITVTH